jgi:flagellar assembly protein FliH
MSLLPSTPRVLRGEGAELLERATITTPQSEVRVEQVVTHYPEPVGLADVAVAVVDANALATAYEEGRRDGASAAAEDTVQQHAVRREQEMRALAERLQSAADVLTANRQAILDTLFEDVGELVFELVRELVGADLALREEPARSAVARALRVAPAHTDLVVRLNPHAAIAAWELESLAPGRRLRVVEDDSVEETGCLLEVGSATIDAQIGPALARLRETLARLGPSANEEEA